MSPGPSDSPEDRPGRDPDEAAWARAGVPYDEVKDWAQWRLSPRDAHAWRSAGVTDALVAAQWQTAGVTPLTVADWTAEGIDATEAVRWHEFGFDLEESAAARAQGQSPIDALKARDTARQRVFGASGAAHAGLDKFQRAGIDHNLAGPDPV